ncbi:MAG: tRNA (adenosine(37)-N6)-threonylcarbamoyltransferase complex transferase subunit TsaD [Candidatus Riflebacteria bacterium]|nr:tRNA (adenosine(37)-N6)-threonylcarbamoyltransferase complex transferase subunit TsaD [Candidatus Riflebacteria bacterium]
MTLLVLGIETSCDDTSVAVVADGRTVLSSVFASQVAVHAPFGGVVPELASRSHLEALPGTLDEALRLAGVGLPQLDGIAVTYGPGLVGSLLVGVMAAKGLAAGLGRPLVGVNHLQAHLAACLVADPTLDPPFLGLVVSGGHTELVRVEDLDRFRLVGATRDDAAGEVLDKVGRLLGLPFPAGRWIEEEAHRGDPDRVRLPRPFLGERLEFSFSGLKTAVSLLARAGLHRREDLCAALQGVLVEVLVRKCEQALGQCDAEVLTVAGGVAANGALRSGLAAMAARLGVRLVVPSRELCTDNAAMVACLGSARLSRGLVSPLTLSAEPSLSIEVN